MSTDLGPATNSKGLLWTGRVLSTIIIAMLAVSGVMKLKMKADADKPPVVAAGEAGKGAAPPDYPHEDIKDAPPQHNPQEDLDKIGWKLEVIGSLAIVELACVILYAIPQTAVLGAILMTGYLGGACATHVRIGEYGMCFVPVGLGVVAWIALYLRDARLRALAPIRFL